MLFEPGSILAVLLLIFVVLLIVRHVHIVPEYQRLVVLALGRYAGTRGPGIVIIIPILERAIRVDMREKFLDIPAQTAITQDNAPISIDFLVYYRVVDPKSSVISVDHVVHASTNIATTTLRAVIGDISLDDVLSKREQINDTLRVKLDEVTERWGLKITSVEIREIEPPRDVQDAMNRQMSAERERRAEVTRASGEREASVTVAEGEKQAAILRAEGARQSAILQAEGEKQAQLLKAQGYAAALKAIEEEAHQAGDNTLQLEYLNTLREIGSSPATKMVLPLDILRMAQRFTGGGDA
ncbi:MAG: SPFH domain-containing protein [Anaerolineaceae bacterium]|nr:SPFH domain-containing protein [Anaerolineaceae bacterium]MDE0327593.1 SPFH domain-containing protein [Anaerolineaceae bacterium]MDE0610769.1 SPFH domain-containing protein [Anaerolineaceae bacterium]